MSLEVLCELFEYDLLQSSHYLQKQQFHLLNDMKFPESSAEMLKIYSKDFQIMLNNESQLL